jgi:hypothetical protein
MCIVAPPASSRHDSPLCALGPCALRASLLPLFIGVRGRGILRSSLTRSGVGGLRASGRGKAKVALLGASTEQRGQQHTHYKRPERALFASWSRVPAGVLFGGLVSFAFRAIRVAAGGLTKDADQYGYGDDHDDHENEQRDYGDGHEIFPSREWCIEVAGRVKPGGLYTTLQQCPR